MNISELNTKHRPSVAVAVALVTLFVLTSITALRIQLLPTIEKPQVSAANFWRATVTSAGFADVGRRQDSVCFIGQFEPSELNELIVGWSNERPINLSELADVEIVARKPDGFTLRNGFDSIAKLCRREACPRGTNGPGTSWRQARGA